MIKEIRKYCWKCWLRDENLGRIKIGRGQRRCRDVRYKSIIKSLRVGSNSRRTLGRVEKEEGFKNKN